VSWANIRVNLLSASKKELHFQLTRGQQDDQTTLRHQYDMRVTEKKTSSQQEEAPPWRPSGGKEPLAVQQQHYERSEKQTQQHRNNKIL
jgi:hypothetical protein